VVKTVDADTSRTLAARFDVRSLPTVIAFVGGREVGRAVGLMQKDKLVTKLKL
jgi:thioredoxin-like negative regulator of GroEL